MTAPTPEDVLIRLLAEAHDVQARENTVYVESEIEVSDSEMELVLEMLDEIRALKDYAAHEKDETDG